MEWMENLSDEGLKNDEGLKKFDSVESLAKSYKNLEALRGNSIRINGPDATAEDKAATYQKVMKHMPELMLKPNPDNPEQMKEYYSMIGVPASIDDYDPGEVSLNPEIISELKKLAESTHMTRDQFKTYIKQMDDMNGMTIQQKEDARTAMGAELKAEWGMAFEDRYSVVEKHLSENQGFGSIEGMTPDQIRAHYAVARSLIGKPQAHNQPSPSNIMTPSEAKHQMAEIMKNPAYMSNNPADRQEHHRLILKMNELRKASDPSLYS